MLLDKFLASRSDIIVTGRDEAETLCCSGDGVFERHEKDPGDEEKPYKFGF